ncbi:MAG: hypothetical protein M3P46_03600 [Actinomycetota bacterium]|nr:hypothetical protein [Actinomycetota bacterium]
MSAPDQHDARDESGDPRTDPAAIGELRAEQPDGDGGAVAGSAGAPVDPAAGQPGA